ncbi:MAG: outer membrane beta-barrel protein [Myxococcales bacterium]
MTLAAVFLAAVLTAMLGSRTARADADDWQLSAAAGIASLVVDGRDPLGMRLALDGQYGLDDAWAVRLTASGGRHGVTSDMAKSLPGGEIYSYALFAGLAYSMDVLRLLPSFEVGLGILGATGAVTKAHRAIGMQAAVGADYLLTPRWSVGGVAAYVYAPFDLISNALTGNAVPQAFSLSVRLGWILH